MRNESDFYAEFSEERRKEIEERAAADALSFLETTFRKNFAREDLPAASPELEIGLLNVFLPIWEKAYKDLGIASAKEVELYRGTFLLKGGYMKE